MINKYSFGFFKKYFLISDEYSVENLCLINDTIVDTLRDRFED